MGIIEIRLEKNTSELFGMDTYTYHHDNSQWGYLGFLLTARTNKGIYKPVDITPVLGLLYAVGCKFMSSEKRISSLDGTLIDFQDLSSVNFGYSTGESYKDINDVFVLAKKRKLSLSNGGILVLCGENPESLDVRIKKLIEPEVAA